MDRKALEQLLVEFQKGDVPVDEVVETIARLPFEVLPEETVDTHRALRTGVPEVVFGMGKTPDQIVRISQVLIESQTNVLVTRLDDNGLQALSDHFGSDEVDFDPIGRIALVGSNAIKCQGRGEIAVVAAGTSDLPVTREAVFTARALGNEVAEITDVGVAGVHRLLHHYNALRKASVLIVVAGMEGALPSVVGGLVRAPIIAVPTSVGYGAAFGGIAALLGMLNSCAPGVTVVNIDNGFGAAYAASLINRKEP